MVVVLVVIAVDVWRQEMENENFMVHSGLT